MAHRDSRAAFSDPAMSISSPFIPYDIIKAISDYLDEYDRKSWGLCSKLLHAASVRYVLENKKLYLDPTNPNCKLASILSVSSVPRFLGLLHVPAKTVQQIGSLCLLQAIHIDSPVNDDDIQIWSTASALTRVIISNQNGN